MKFVSLMKEGMDSSDYFSILDEIVADKLKFHQIKVSTKIHPIVAKENSTAYYVCKYSRNCGPETQ